MLSELLVRTTQFGRMFTVDVVEITVVERPTDTACASSSSYSSSIEKRLDFAQYDEQFFFVFAWQFVVVTNSPSSQFNDLLFSLSFFFAFFLCKMTCRTKTFMHNSIVCTLPLTFIDNLISGSSH